MKVLVTGATGFIGSHIVDRLLARGQEVRAFARNPEKAAAVLPAGVETVYGDVRDAASLRQAAERVDCVIHAAARVTDWGPWSAFEAETVRGTEHALEAAIAAGVSRFVLVSTVSVYDSAAVRSGNVTEDAPYTRDRSAGNRYGYAKMLAERAAFDAHRRGSLVVSAIRPAWVYGTRDRSLLPRMLEFLRSPMAAWVRGYDPLVGLVYVTDVAEACVLAATTPIAAGRAYNISADRPYKLKEFAALVATAAGIKPPSRSVPYSLALTAALLSEGLARLIRAKEPPSLTRQALALLLEGNPYDISRAKNDLGWEPTVGMDDGVRLMMDWARQAGLI